MSNNILTKVAADFPDCDILIAIVGDQIPQEVVPNLIERSIRHKTEACYMTKVNRGVRVVPVKGCEGITNLKTREFKQITTVGGFPRMQIAGNAVAIYLVTVHDMITFETMCDSSKNYVVDLEHPETENIKVQMPGIDLIPVCYGSVSVTSVNMGPSDNLVSNLIRTVVLAMLASRGIVDLPAGFAEEVGGNFVVGPCDDDTVTDRYNMAFHSADKVEEHKDITIEQVFALYESRKAVTIQ